MTQILGHEKEGLVFEIISARICDEVEEKKHVIYTLQVRHVSGNDDLSPSVIERRYTHFLLLYNALRKEHPTLMTTIIFPKKVFLGNFDNELISARSTGFESLLKHISSKSKLKSSRALLDFLQNIELYNARQLLQERDFSGALPLLEKNFKLLNKVLTDRSPAVLLALCRVVAASAAISGYPGTQKWASLALHRYEGVSDSDLLELYVPLIILCISIWRQHQKNTDALEERLQALRRQGVKVGRERPFMDEVDLVEKKIFG